MDLLPFYDGGNAVVELNESGDVISTNIYAPDGLVAKRMADGTTGSYLFDLQGNTAEIITGNGVKVNAAYNAWGQCNYMNPVPFPNDPFMQHAYNARWGYLGDETGLYYCQNRYYDPGTGRFLTRDPIGYAGGMNLYGYCGGGPVGNADYLGTVLVRVIAYPVAKPGYHLGILVIDNQGSNRVFSFAGGPSDYGVYSVISASLESKSAPWVDGQQDFEGYHDSSKKDRVTMTLIDDCSSYDSWIAKFESIEKDVNSRTRKSYQPLPSDSYDEFGDESGSANSNTWASYLLQSAGLMDEYDRAFAKRKKAVGMPWLPGFSIGRPFYNWENP